MDLTKAQTLALHHMNRLALIGWTFKFDRAKVRFGQCDFEKKVISLSAPLTALNDESQVLDTILHECAHALAGHKAGHGPRWKAVAESVGASPERCGDGVGVPRKWQGECPACGKKIERFRRKRIACIRCCEGEWNPDYLFVWTTLDNPASVG